MNMNPNAQRSVHLTEEQLIAVAVEDLLPTPLESTHLADCVACQERLAVYQSMARELLIAKASTVSTAAQERYIALFQSPQENRAGIADRLVQLADAVKASIMWNGHARLAMDGVRSASATSYRMLYGTDFAEIELLIEPAGSGFNIEGELVPLQAPERLLPVALEVHRGQGNVLFQGESDEEGRFQIPAMNAGTYSLFLIPVNGKAVLIDKLELCE